MSKYGYHLNSFISDFYLQELNLLSRDLSKVIFYNLCDRHYVVGYECFNF